MTLTDCRGNDVTAANQEAVDALDAAVRAYLGLRLDPGDRLKEALTADPDMVLGHVLRGNFMMFFANRGLLSRADASLGAAREAADKVGATARERLHIDALDALLLGEAPRAVAIWENILIDHPLDVMALKFSEYWNFYAGDARAMRDTVSRRLYAWDDATPDVGFVHGMYAFGLEESGDYAAAEESGRKAVSLNAEDVWATHAVAHVLEMTGRPAEGIAWLEGLNGNWEMVNNFAYHAWWHLALFHWERGEFDAVLELYDTRVRPESTDDYLDITNGVALLWRLELEGVDVGDRWRELAEKSASRGEDHLLVFADVHYAMALAAAGEGAAASKFVQDAGSYAQAQRDTQSRVMQPLGVTLCEAALAHRGGAAGHCADLLWPVRGDVVRIGGSHAQRDLFSLMLIDAAIRSGQISMARALLSERLALKPNSLLTWRRLAAFLDEIGDPDAAEARSKAESLAA